ncbi:sodium:calcium symporter [Thermus scotoductus]|uniref:Sodium:calcium symporter n=1 Tax=Thermus scotoductus TaxID=37636 RepID=A0A0N0ZQ31_THESC|nr:sodium:calcium symporter [Thermus scotoductus]
MKARDAMTGPVVSTSRNHPGRGGPAYVGKGLVTTLPEATVTLAAARLGAVDLALGNVLGSVMFNTFLLSYADPLFPGPLLAQVEGSFSVLVLLGMAGTVLTGLMY